MEFFLDTANVDEIKAAQAQGLMDGVTTNPTLLSREGGDWKAQASEICKIVEGPVSLEVVGATADEMIVRLRTFCFGENVVIKVPMTSEGLVATKVLYKKD